MNELIPVPGPAHTADTDDPALHMLEHLWLQMHAEMSANRFKGDAWSDADGLLMAHELLYHVVKLLRAARAVEVGASEAVREYAADVANCAGILADALGAWDQQPPFPLGNQDNGYVPESRELLRGTAYRMMDAFNRSMGTPADRALDQALLEAADYGPVSE